MLARAIPWYLWCALLSSSTVAIGVHWDIAWHRSIGRDTFWSPPHIMIYAAAVLAALASGSQILRATLARRPGGGAAGAGAGAGAESDGSATVRVLGFRGPLGAFITAWGGITMLTSAPFDDWWHNAYGLDVKILSPPHVVLAIGIGAIHVGVLIFVLGRLNRVSGRARQALTTGFLWVGAMLIAALMTLFMERTVRPFMHGAPFYRIIAAIVPLLFAAVARGSGHRWGASIAAGFYSLFLLALLWILPLVPAEPKLGPVTVPVTSLVPPEFPLLLIVPALALDLLWARTADWSRGRQALAGGALFVALFFAVQWPFATFLMSPAARNYFFGAIYFDYFTPPQSHYWRYQFIPHPSGPAAFLTGAVTATAIAVIGTWLGIGWGNWMRRIHR
ncbi:MAG TPA: hypothetical protein VFH68_21680 [Polyangia bacterium]|jgi:hypothetical protein|nr:hypothetical protein [Polyangia bacterium]